MKAGPAFVIGAALGYLVGTEKGRAQLDKARDWATETWHDPRVQEKVTELKDRASGTAA